MDFLGVEKGSPQLSQAPHPAPSHCLGIWEGKGHSPRVPARVRALQEKFGAGRWEQNCAVILGLLSSAHLSPLGNGLGFPQIPTAGSLQETPKPLDMAKMGFLLQVWICSCAEHPAQRGEMPLQLCRSRCPAHGIVSETLLIFCALHKSQCLFLQRKPRGLRALRDSASSSGGCSCLFAEDKGPDATHIP